LLISVGDIGKLVLYHWLQNELVIHLQPSEFYLVDLVVGFVEEFCVIIKHQFFFPIVLPRIYG
jgi:hypothetical protein